MVIQSNIRYLLLDEKSLTNYMQGEEVSVQDIKRRLLLLDRLENQHIPDHFYRRNEENTFKELTTIKDILTKGIYSLSDNYLECINNRIYVKHSVQNQWQELLTYMSPLILQAAYLAKRKPLLDTSYEALKDYLIKFIIPNFKYTALPFPYIPQLEHYVNNVNGLHDLHIHLNGTTESDIVWQIILYNPHIIKINQDKVKEQMEQESYICNEMTNYNLVCEARKLRDKLFLVYYLNNTTELKNDDISMNHPLALLFDEYKNQPEKCLPLEALFYVIIFTELYKNKHEIFAKYFHVYLLIEGHFHRLLVQQIHQNGFEQFQKITLNGIRADSEKKYLTRFLQLQGNDCRYINYLEGRFSPKRSQLENELLLKTIYDGWNRMLCEISNCRMSTPTLKLIAHFIKQPDTHPDKYIRHKKLRKELYEKAKILSIMFKNRSPYLKDFVGIDAASSEFDAPPEVFAPIYRMLRRNGIQHFTYHAGEDFYTIISGLRAIYEAVEFTELRCGDRIGHGTAMGISPKVWTETLGSRILMKQGDYLDDLVFVYHFIDKNQIFNLNRVLHFIENKINALSLDIYNEVIPLQILIKAWQLRKYCPILLFSENIEVAKYLSTFNEEEWYEIQALNIQDADITKTLQKYHSKKYRMQYDKNIEVETLEFFTIDDIVLLQQKMLEHLHNKEIVIETLPTSNIRIGIHHHYDTYQLWNWIQWQKDGYSIPPIIMGTDDSGIFSTNIYNEFANIYNHLTCSGKMTHNEAINLIETLDKNGQIYKFANKNI